MKTVLCFGDSNTNGCNPQTDIRDWVEVKKENPPGRYPKNVRWPGVVQNLLGFEYDIIEEGLPGRTFMYSDAILPNRAGKDHIQMCMDTHNPVDLLIIMLGTNDAKCLYHLGTYAFAVGVEEFLKIAKNPALWPKGKEPNILLIAPPPLGENIKHSYFYGMFDEDSVALTRQFGELYEKLAKANGCHFLDAGLYAKSDDTGDSLHFSPESHAKLGAAIAEKIKEILG